MAKSRASPAKGARLFLLVYFQSMRLCPLTKIRTNTHKHIYLTISVCRGKSAGGRWSLEKKVGRVQFGAIRNDAELIERILNE
jgi:hypothetical protein